MDEADQTVHSILAGMDASGDQETERPCAGSLVRNAQLTDTPQDSDASPPDNAEPSHSSDEIDNEAQVRSVVQQSEPLEGMCFHH